MLPELPCGVGAHTQTLRKPKTNKKINTHAPFDTLKFKKSVKFMPMEATYPIFEIS